MRLPRAVVDAVWARDLSRCFRCGRILHRGSGGYSIHHRRPGGMGGRPLREQTRLSCLLLLCGSGVTRCHGWVESNREAAKGQGLLVEGTADPAARPVNRWQREWVMLADDGTVGTPR